MITAYTATDLAGFAFLDALDEVVDVLSEEARQQGFRVELVSPDRRHTEI
jgi:hypothetical protein